MRVAGAWLAIGASLLAAGCASIGQPPGGPEDKAPPEIISASIDTNATDVSAGQLEVRFDEIVSERPAVSGGPNGSPVTLDAVVLMSPRTGTAKVTWHRDRITIEPRGGFRPNTTYRITLLPGISDIRGNVRRDPATFTFSTGAKIQPYGILGRLFDWQLGLPIEGAMIEAVGNPGTADSLVYQAVSDTLGQFDVGPLGAGSYLVRGYIDSDHNRERGVLEKWDTVTVNVTDHRPSIELLAIQRDTAAIGVRRVQALDSLWVRVELDKPFDPRVQLLPTMVVLKSADSTEIPVAAVMTEAQATFLRPRGDSTTAARRPAAPPVTPPPQPAQPPAARPSIPAPETVIVLRLTPAAPLKPGARYTLVVRGLRNLIGHTGSATAVFDAPKPAAKPPAKPPA